MADVASVSASPKPLTIAFYLAFTLWFTAARYSDPSFYGRLLTPLVGNILGLSTIALVLIVLVLAVRRAVRAAFILWLDVAVLGFAIVAFDLFWRFYLSPLAWDAFKLTSVALDVATPLVAAFGVAAVVSEWREGQALAG